jgi:hypothetical protein
MLGLGRGKGAAPMAKRNWKVDWRTQPKSDGLERLGQAVKLVMDRTVRTETKQRGEQTKLVAHVSADALEELDT